MENTFPLACKTFLMLLLPDTSHEINYTHAKHQQTKSTSDKTRKKEHGKSAGASRMWLWVFRRNTSYHNEFIKATTAFMLRSSEVPIPLLSPVQGNEALAKPFSAVACKIKHCSQAGSVYWQREENAVSNGRTFYCKAVLE